MLFRSFYHLNSNDDLSDFIGENGYFSTIFDFSTELLSAGEHGWYDAPDVAFPAWKKAIFHAQDQAYGCGFESNIIENHDEPRGASRYLPVYARNSCGTKMLGTMSLLLRGLPFIFQGQEIGMTNTNWQSVDEFDDLNTVDQYHLALKAGLSEKDALDKIGRLSRDNARTPMQWDDSANAGFTTGTPWISVNKNYTQINAKAALEDKDSVFYYYQKLIRLRHENEIIVEGVFHGLLEDNDDIYAYERTLGDEKLVVACNFTNKEVPCDLFEGKEGEELITNYKNHVAGVLQPYETRVILYK